MRKENPNHDEIESRRSSTYCDVIVPRRADRNRRPCVSSYYAIPFVAEDVDETFPFKRFTLLQIYLYGAVSDAQTIRGKLNPSSHETAQSFSAL
eukprot:4598040-Pleurochrysis_carterae.AAC.6